MSNTNTPCDVCPEHRGGAPTMIREHTFTRDWREDPDPGDWRSEEWRWLCACGSRGRWQSQSPAAAYHAWLVHCGVPHDYTGEGAAP